MPNGFGVAYLTCFDGESQLMGSVIESSDISDRLYAVHNHVADRNAK